MSQYGIAALRAFHEVTVGYDQPLRTFFANVVDVRLDVEHNDPSIFQVGQGRGEVPTVEALALVLAPYAMIPPDVLLSLRAEEEQRRSRLRARLNWFSQEMDQLRRSFTTVCVPPSPEGAGSMGDVSWTDPEAERLYTRWAAYAADLQRELQRLDVFP